MSGAGTPPDLVDVAPATEPLIVARGVTRILPGIVPVTLVHDIDLAIGGNEFVAITGPSGSGKSSLLYLLGLLDLPTAGEVRIRSAPPCAWTRPSAPASGCRHSGSFSSSTSCCRSFQRWTT